MQIFINILILQKNQFNCDILLHAYVLFISAINYLLLPSPSYIYYSPIIFFLLSDYLVFQDSTHRQIHMTCQNLPYFTWQHDLKLLFTFHICPCWCPLIFSDKCFDWFLIFRQRVTNISSNIYLSLFLLCILHGWIWLQCTFTFLLALPLYH
jgi:hypothetical protein